MTCANCEKQVQQLLSSVPGVTAVKIDHTKGEAEITMGPHINTSAFQDALKSTKYQIEEKWVSMPVIPEEEPVGWFQTYKPILLIFAFITGIATLAQWHSSDFSWETWMNHFMAGFFLTFSFFKLLNLQGFADNYSGYDIIARRWRSYAYIYAFLELFLGIAYLVHFLPVVTNTLTVLVMSISLIGVLQSVLNKRKIRCACLGDVFNLPMSTVTIIEDVLMIVMSGWMLITYLY